MADLIRQPNRTRKESLIKKCGDDEMSDSRRRDVVRLRPRTSDDLSRQHDEAYQPESGDDHRIRMRINIAAVIFTVMLTIAGIWLATSLADIHKTQNCVLMGLRNCAGITGPLLSPRSGRASALRFAETGLVRRVPEAKSPPYSEHKNTLQG